MPPPYPSNKHNSFEVTCHHQDFIQFCGPACLLMLINHLEHSDTKETSEVELYKELLAHDNAGDYGMKAPPEAMLGVLNAKVKTPYKIIWGTTAAGMADWVVYSILDDHGPVLVPVKDKNHWLLFRSAETDAEGNLKSVGIRNPVTVGAPEFDPTGPEYNHAPGTDPCKHDAPHIQEQFVDADGLLVLLKPTQWAFQVYRNLAIVPADLNLPTDEDKALPGAAPAKSGTRSGSEAKTAPE